MPLGKASGPPNALTKGLKRKEPSHSGATNDYHGHQRNRDPKRAKMVDARTILSQKGDAALKDGELDLQAFLKSREFEIKALHDGMERSKSSRTTRAFQQVPRDLRRRTASHNVKRVPKRLHKRAQREMVEDNTPTVDANKRKPSGSTGRIRAETAKRLEVLAAQKRDQKQMRGIETRPAIPKIRRNRLNDPPKPKSKYRKRQIHKTWLPTHMWHTKRATMTEPTKPLWRFAIPLTSTEKSYRPTHRAGNARGCIAWDMSYVSTIGLQGPSLSIEKVLKAMGVLDTDLWDIRGEKWRLGKRSWSGWLSKEINEKVIQICPSTVLWCPTGSLEADPTGASHKLPTERLFIRVHPAAFLQTWEELLRLSKLQRPIVHIEDLRYEIGSIDITGPGSTETLLGILHPFTTRNEPIEPHAEAFNSLRGVTNPAILPANSLLSFSILDPRLQYPPRPAPFPRYDDEEANRKLLETVAKWPVDNERGSGDLFLRYSRYKAICLPSQKALNRRKALAPPGQYAIQTEKDPAIPIILLTSRMHEGSSAQGTWTLLAPWKCILPIWHCINHYPLSSGGNPRFGGLNEIRQLHFENQVPWFPADYPGTAAGYGWEEEQRSIKKMEWDRRPKGKRVEWESLNLGMERKGEIGLGWACDFDIITKPEVTNGSDGTNLSTQNSTMNAAPGDLQSHLENANTANTLHIQREVFGRLLLQPSVQMPSLSTVSTVRISLLGRGVANQCARIYRLPAMKAQDSSETGPGIAQTGTREAWLRLLSSRDDNSKPEFKSGTKQKRIPLNVPLSKRVRLMAKSLLEQPAGTKTSPNNKHPSVPGEDDLIGFITTGAFNLAEGKGVAIGSVVVTKVLEDVWSISDSKRRVKEGRLCIVRNAGEEIGRLARWQPV